jgi:hypothetical protein
MTGPLQSPLAIIAQTRLDKDFSWAIFRPGPGGLYTGYTGTHIVAGFCLPVAAQLPLQLAERSGISRNSRIPGLTPKKRLKATLVCMSAPILSS